MNPILNALNFLESKINLLSEFYPEQQLRNRIEEAKLDLKFNLEHGYEPFAALNLSSAREHIPDLTLTFKIDQTSNELKIKANFSSFICSSMEQIREISRLADSLSGNHSAVVPSMFV